MNGLIDMRDAIAVFDTADFRDALRERIGGTIESVLLSIAGEEHPWRKNWIDRLGDFEFAKIAMHAAKELINATLRGAVTREEKRNAIQWCDPFGSLNWAIALDLPGPSFVGAVAVSQARTAGNAARNLFSDVDKQMGSRSVWVVVPAGCWEGVLLRYCGGWGDEYQHVGEYTLARSLLYRKEKPPFSDKVAFLLVTLWAFLSQKYNVALEAAMALTTIKAEK